MKIPLNYRRRPGRISLVVYAAAHAPAGGVTIGGKKFAGGQFIPAKVMASATPEERAAVESGEARGKPLPPEGGVRLKEPPRPQQTPEPVPHATAAPSPGGPVPIDHTSSESFAASLGTAYAAGGHDPAVATAVASRMPPSVMKRLARGLQSVRVHPTVEGVVDSFYDGDPELRNTPRTRRQRTLGFFDAAQRHLETDGGPDPQGTLAHELFHAVDYEGDWDLSGQDEFRYIWTQEIKNGNLTNYAATDPAEGFAEFGRLLYGPYDSDRRAAETEFPLTMTFFRKYGLA